MCKGACLMLLQYVQLCGELRNHQHGAPSQRLLAAQNVSIDVVPNIQHLEKQKNRTRKKKKKKKKSYAFQQS